jgi:S-formylglutathione hydrolase FrmB
MIRRLQMLTAAILTFTGVMLPVTAHADPAADRGPSVTSLDHVQGTLWNITVHSPAMGADIPFQLIRPSGNSAGAPTIYLLNGAGGGEDGSGWLEETDALQFFADKRVNILIPQRGSGTLYTDWIASDPQIGRPMWETLLTRELPPVIDAALDTNARNAIIGLSMSATSVLDLATAAPGLYRSVASISGCAQTSTPVGQAVVRSIVRSSGADPVNMWGPVGSPMWTQHDPLLNAEKLRGTALYLSSGDGRAGKYDNDRSAPPGAPPVENRIVVGGAIEAGARYCTEAMTLRLAELSIPATVHLPVTGTHSWRYFQDELHRSWPTVEAGLRAER